MNVIQAFIAGRWKKNKIVPWTVDVSIAPKDLVEFISCNCKGIWLIFSITFFYIHHQVTFLMDKNWIHNAFIWRSWGKLRKLSIRDDIQRLQICISQIYFLISWKLYFDVMIYFFFFFWYVVVQPVNVNVYATPQWTKQLPCTDFCVCGTKFENANWIQH